MKKPESFTEYLKLSDKQKLQLLKEEKKSELEDLKLGYYEDFYQKDTSYQATYADRQKAYYRLNNVADPKAKWVISVYEKHFKDNPFYLMDLGAGSGHFVRACRDLGLSAFGTEISQSGVNFAKEVFNVNLDKENVDEMEIRKDQIITFFGFLEHLINPKKLLRKVRKSCNMVVIEVPNWNSFSTTVQCLTGQASRHAVPFEHLHMFTRRSLERLLKECGFKPIAWWFFGMDMFELSNQVAYNSNLKAEDVYKGLSKFQNALDRREMSDFMTVAAV